jgi:hypothetical protein
MFLSLLFCQIIRASKEVLKLLLTAETADNISKWKIPTSYLCLYRTQLPDFTLQYNEILASLKWGDVATWIRVTTICHIRV